MKTDFRALNHCRSVLLRIGSRLSPSDLDWMVLPDSKTIGEALIHIAAFEFFVVSCVNFETDAMLCLPLWHQLKGGFSREAGFRPPRGFNWTDYTNLLQEVRQFTEDTISTWPNHHLVARTNLNIESLANALSLQDHEYSQVVYTKLVHGVSTSVADASALDASNDVDIIALLSLHETYHRGQITFQQYLLDREQKTKTNTPSPVLR